VPIRSYRDAGTRDVAENVNSKVARKVLPPGLHGAARRRLAFLDAAASLDDLRTWRGLNLHDLKEDRAGQWAIRINDRYRICFFWQSGFADQVQVADYH
jgi:toxin HigB-1